MAESFVLCPSPAAHDHSGEVPIVEEDIIEENSPWNLRHLTSKNDQGPSALQRIQELRRSYGLSALMDFRSVQKVIRDTLATFASDGSE